MTALALLLACFALSLILSRAVVWLSAKLTPPLPPAPPPPTVTYLITWWNGCTTEVTKADTLRCANAIVCCYSMRERTRA